MMFNRIGRRGAALLVAATLAIATAPTAQAATGTFGGCTFTYNGSAVAKSAYVTGVKGCQGAAKVAARVYWYASGTGTTEYSTVGSYVQSGQSTATFSSGLYSRASFAGKY